MGLEEQGVECCRLGRVFHHFGARLFLIVFVASALSIGDAGSLPSKAAAPDVARLHRLAQFVADLEPGHWRELPGDPRTTFISKADALRISEGDPDAADRLWGWGGPKETFNAYSGAAFDGRRLYFFGGGHHHYRGNDIKVYDLETLSWSRLYDPSPMTAETFTAPKRFVPARGPRAVHSYDSFIYTPKTNALYLFGSRARSIWKFDLTDFERNHDPWRAWQPIPWPDTLLRNDTSFQKAELLPDGRILLIVAGRGPRSTVFDPVTETITPPQRSNGTVAVLTWRDATARAYTVSGNALDEYDGEGRMTGTAVTRLPALLQANANRIGIAYDSKRDRFLFWPGNRAVWVWQPADNVWAELANSEGAAPVMQKGSGVWSKWVYLAPLDIFLGMVDPDHSLWAYRAPDTVPVASAAALLEERHRLERAGFECADTVPGWKCPPLQPQLLRGEVTKGVYLQCGTVRRAVDFHGSRLQRAVCGSKAALIAKDGAEIRNVEISDISIGVNAACIRWAAGSLTLHNVQCRNADMGLLGKGTRLEMSDSDFGETLDAGTNHGHVLYLVSAEEVHIRNSRIHDPGSEGHVLKSGAKRLVVEDTILAAGDRPYSRIIDAFNGGRLELRNVELVAGSTGGNGDVIGFGAEMRQKFQDNEIIMDGGRVDCHAGLTRRLIHLWEDRTGPVKLDWHPQAVVGCPPAP